jgi:AraC-like DNA-binding protein
MDFEAIRYVSRGNAKLAREGSLRPIAKGDLFFQGEGEDLYVLDPQELELTSVMFHGRILAELAPGQAEWANLGQLMARTKALLCGRLAVHLGIMMQSKLEAIFSRIIKERAARHEGWMSIIASQVIEMLVDLIRMMVAQTALDSECSSQVANAVAYMEAHLGERVSLPDIAKHACTSERQLCRIFKDAYGISPYRYLLNLRMNLACELLTREELPIMDIATRCGFEDSNHFSRQFHTYIGLSPTVYREKARSKGIF